MASFSQMPRITVPRILEDLTNGTLICSICTEAITQVGGREYSIWNCRTCYNVLHLECVRSWAAASGARLSRHHDPWNCPNCNASEYGFPQASCWCGQRPSYLIQEASEPINSCRKPCVYTAQCPHGISSTCETICHPGPCKVTCKPECVVPVASEAATLSTWDRLMNSLRRKEKSTVRKIAYSTTLLLVIYAFIAVFISYHIKWWSQPYKYPNLVGNCWEPVALTLVGIPTGLITGCLIIEVVNLAMGASSTAVDLNATGSTRASSGGRRSSSSAIFVLILALGIWSLPIIGLAAGPSVAWRNQMKNSCNGFDLRTNMDEYRSNSIKPAQHLQIQDFRLDNLSNFYLGAHLLPHANKTRPFQYFHRFSGPSTTPNSPSHFAIDIDLQNHMFRVMHENITDYPNVWLAEQLNSFKTPSSEQYKADGDVFLRQVPVFEPMTGNILYMGNFTAISREQKHLHIPLFDIVIANLHEFVYSCYQEPFLRVFNASGLSSDEVAAMISAEWHPQRHNDRIIMRTASFGLQAKRLDMCSKDVNLWNNEIWVEDKYLNWTMEKTRFVPMAIVSALRFEVWQRNVRSFDCR